MDTVLFLGPRPSDAPALRLKDEVQKIIFRLSEIDEARSKLRLRSQWGVQFGDLPNLLTQIAPTILHISGHGSAASEMVFEDDLGKAALVSKEAMARLFSVGAIRRNTRCLLLNACSLDETAKELSQYIDFVIGTAAPIADVAAIAFAQSFYPALASGYSVRDAFDIATAMFMGAAKGQPTPNLHVRPGADANAPFLVAPGPVDPPRATTSTGTSPGQSPVPPRGGKPLVFVNHVERDGALSGELTLRLERMRRDGRLEFWDVSQIRAGEVRRQVIEQQIEKADIVLLLVSADAMADEEWSDLKDRALARRRAGQSRVVPILLRATLLGEDSFDGIKPLPTQKKSVMSFNDRDEAWLEVIEKIVEILPRP